MILTKSTAHATKPSTHGLDVARVTFGALAGTTATTTGMFFSLWAIVVTVLCLVSTGFVLVHVFVNRRAVDGALGVGVRASVARRAGLRTRGTLELTDAARDAFPWICQTASCMILTSRTVIVAAFADRRSLAIHKAACRARLAAKCTGTALEAAYIAALARDLAAVVLESASLAVFAHAGAGLVLVLALAAPKATRSIAWMGLKSAKPTWGANAVACGGRRRKLHLTGGTSGKATAYAILVLCGRADLPLVTVADSVIGAHAVVVHTCGLSLPLVAQAHGVIFALPIVLRASTHGFPLLARTQRMRLTNTVSELSRCPIRNLELRVAARFVRSTNAIAGVRWRHSFVLRASTNLRARA